MCALVPGVHGAEQRIALVNDQHRAFDARHQLWSGHDHRNFNDAFLLRIEPRHLAIEPHQILIGARQQGSGRRGNLGNIGHPRIVSEAPARTGTAGLP